MEQIPSKINAKIAEAVDMSRQAKEMATYSSSLLITIEIELDELYIELDTCKLGEIEK